MFNDFCITVHNYNIFLDLSIDYYIFSFLIDIHHLEILYLILLKQFQGIKFACFLMNI